MQAITPAQAKHRYPDEWVLMEVAKESPSGQVLKGKIIAHSPDRDVIYEAQLGRREYLYIFFSGTIPKPGYAFGF
jgi:hypothetical protein